MEIKDKPQRRMDKYKGGQGSYRTAEPRRTFVNEYHGWLVSLLVSWLG
jgi:hypothetical protein